MPRPIFKRKYVDPVPLWEAYWANRSVANRNALVTHYYPLVPTIATTMPRCRHNWDDYISDGAVLLMRAVEMFDGQRGTSFLTFASKKVKGGMQDGLRNRDHHTRQARQYARMRDDIIGVFLAQYGRNPTRDELRAAIRKAHPEWSARRLENVVTGRTVDLEPLVRTGPKGKRFISPDAEQSCPAADKDHRTMVARDEIKACRQCLPEKDRPLFDLYPHGRTLKEVSLLMGKAESRASQIWAQLRSYIVAHRKAA